MTIQKAIQFFEFMLHCIGRVNIAVKDRNTVAAIELAVAALKEQEERENPKPLTLEELLALNDEPVWIWFIDSPARWVIRNSLCWVDSCCPERMAMFNMKWYKHSAYGADWVAYRYKPKEG